MVITRKDYMASDNITDDAYDGRKGHDAHAAYYGQYVNDWHVQKVVERIGAAALMASRDLNLNDIPLSQWDALPATHHMAAKAKEFGDGVTLSLICSVYKTAARQWLSANGGAKPWPIKYTYPDRGNDGGPRWFNRSYAVGHTEDEALSNFIATNKGTVGHEIYEVEPGA